MYLVCEKYTTQNLRTEIERFVLQTTCLIIAGTMKYFTSIVLLRRQIYYVVRASKASYRSEINYYLDSPQSIHSTGLEILFLEGFFLSLSLRSDLYYYPRLGQSLI